MHTGQCSQKNAQEGSADCATATINSLDITGKQAFKTILELKGFFLAQNAILSNACSRSSKQQELESWGFQQSLKLLYLIMMTVATMPAGLSTFAWYLSEMSLRFWAKETTRFSASNTGPNFSTYERLTKQEIQISSIAHSSTRLRTCGIILLQTFNCFENSKSERSQLHASVCTQHSSVCTQHAFLWSSNRELVVGPQSYSPLARSFLPDKVESKYSVPSECTNALKAT